jgi:hypothetical protein
MSFGQGIYDSFNREVESMISEGMTINMSMNSEGQGGPTKSLTVTATEEDAEQLAQMLSNAGIASRQMPGHGAEEMFSAGPMDHEESCESCGMQTCGCGDIEEALDENNPDWPTEPTGQEDNINYYDTDGLNGRKTTGQSTVPVLASQNDRQGMAEAMRNTGDDIDDMVEDYLDYLESVGMIRNSREEEKAEILADLDSGVSHSSEIEYALSGTKWDPLAPHSVEEEDSLHRMMEMAGITEAKSEKPDFLDVDDDKNNNESFKDAVDDKKAASNKKVRESVSTVDTMEQNLMRQFSNFKI